VNCNLCEMICPEFAIFSLEAAPTIAAAPSQPRGEIVR
jgi:Pyruvate/2-oxoacid:ferredoxin oxidoreductase delta subunit